MVDFAGSGIPQFGGQMVGPEQLAQLQQIMGANWGMPLAMGGTLGDLLGHLFGGAPQAGQMGAGSGMTGTVIDPGGIAGAAMNPTARDMTGTIMDPSRWINAGGSAKLPEVQLPGTPGQSGTAPTPGFGGSNEPGRYGALG